MPVCLCTGGPVAESPPATARAISLICKVILALYLKVSKIRPAASHGEGRGGRRMAASPSKCEGADRPDVRREFRRSRVGPIPCGPGRRHRPPQGRRPLSCCGVAVKEPNQGKRTKSTARKIALPGCTRSGAWDGWRRVAMKPHAAQPRAWRTPPVFRAEAGAVGRTWSGLGGGAGLSRGETPK